MYTFRILCIEILPRYLLTVNLFFLIQVFIKSELKVGVIFIGENQYTEEQILGNTEHTPQFSEFLTLLGDRVRLKGKS